MAWIELHAYSDGCRITVNSQNITAIRDITFMVVKRKVEYTTIELSGGTDIDVKESYDKVKGLIEEVERG